MSNNAGSVTSSPAILTVTETLGSAGPRLNPITGLFEDNLLVVVPAGGLPSGGALMVWIYDLGVDSRGRPIQVYNATGVSNGVPYISLNGPLPAGTVLLTVQYIVLDRTTVPTPRYVIQVVPAPQLTGTPVPISSTNTAFANGAMHLTFQTLAGRTYFVQYSSNLTTGRRRCQRSPATVAR